MMGLVRKRRNLIFYVRNCTKKSAHKVLSFIAQESLASFIIKVLYNRDKTPRLNTNIDKGNTYGST